MFNFAKCSFLKTSVIYLGYVIHNGEVRPNPGKIHALSSLPAPTTVTQLRQFDKIKEEIVNLAEMSKDWLLAEQRRDPQIVEITRKLQNYELAEDIANTYELQPGTLYRRIQRKGETLCLPIEPRGFRWSVINHMHQSIMHLGWDKTPEKLHEYYWFEGMAKYVR